MNEELPKFEHLRENIPFSVPEMKDISKRIEERHKEIFAQLRGRKEKSEYDIQALLSLIDEDAEKMIRMMKSLQSYVHNNLKE